MALLTVVVPLYNQESFIDQCVSSIQNQSLTDVEIIIVDDGSTDSSSAILDNYLLTDIKEISIIYPLYVKLIFI